MLFDVLLRIEVNEPATKTRLPMYAMSVISPVVMRGVLVRTIVVARRVCPGTGCRPAAGAAWTVMVTDTWLLALALLFVSIASTVYV